MSQPGKSTLSRQDLAILLRDGHPGVEGNVTRTAFQRVVEEWESNPDTEQKLEVLRKSPIGVEALVPEEKYDPESEQFYLGPNKTPQTLQDFRPSHALEVAEEFAQDYLEAHCKVYRELLEESSLTKKQFLAYLMKEGNANEHMIADVLDVEVGTVRSHAGRAREKVETAQRTARIPELFTVEGYHELKAEMNELLEPQPA